MAIRYLVHDEKGNGRLPVSGEDGKPDRHLMGAAWAALHSGYRGNKYEGPGKAEALAKLKALYKSEGIEWPGEQGPESGARSSESDSLLVTRHSSLRFMVLLAEAPATGLIRIPIAITGQWKGAEKEFSVGLDDLEEIRKNFAAKPTGEINVDYEHASEVPFGTGGPVLSAGRVVKLDEPEEYENGSRQVGSGQVDGPSAHLTSSPSARFILWGWYEPTERARTLIANREYRYISPAIRWGAKDKVTGKAIGTVLTSVALVNKPFLEELPAIQGGADLHFSGPRIFEPQSSKAEVCATEILGEQKVFVSLGQLHVPGAVNQVSVAYGQPGSTGQSEIPRSARNGRKEGRTENVGPSGARPEENDMAKSLKLKCLTDAHLEKHDLPKSYLGKIGVFDGDELTGVAEDGPDGWSKEGEGNGTTASAPHQTVQGSEVFASEIGMPGKSLAEIAAMVKRGVEASFSPASAFAALSEAIHDGKIDTVKAGELADAGKVRFSTILAAQEAERKVDAAVKSGKVLPKDRAHALKLALSDTAAFAALVEEARPVVDLATRGHAAGGEAPTAQQSLMAEVNAYARENKCSVSVALSEVTKRQPALWRAYSEEIVTAVGAEVTEEE
jgi:hypothetical protein